MSERDLLDGLNDSLSIEELMRVPESQGLTEQDMRLARLRGEPGSQERSIPAPDDGDIMGPRTPLRAFRQSYLDELERNPAVHQKLLALTQAEVGNQGPEAQQAFIESVFNRAASRKQSLNEAMQTVDRGGYYPGLGDISKVSPTTAANYDDLIKQVGTGSNVGNYATGNASGTVGFNKGPQVAAFGGERFGIEGPDLGTMRGIAGGEIDPTAFTVPDRQPTGRRKMADEGPRGILDFLTGGQQLQQPQGAPQGGLLGMLGDPETMSYLAMMLKGANPYSNLDPNSMLSNAQTLAMRRELLRQQQAEQARDNARADRALNLRESEFGLARTEREAREAERIRLKQEAIDLAAKQRKKDTEVFSDLAGRPRPPDATTDPTAVAVPAAPFEALTNDQKIDLIDQKLAKDGENMSPAGVNRLQKMREQLAKPPSASMQKQMTTDENAIPVYDAVGAKIDRALELAPKVATGFRATLQAGPAGRFMGSAAPQETKDTIEFQNLTSQFAIENMSQTMKGPTSDKEMFKNLAIAADERNPTEIRIRALEAAKARNDQLKAVASNRLKQMQEGTYGRKQKPPSESGGGGGDPLDIR